MEAEIEKWKLDYVLLIQSSIRFPTGDSVEDAELVLFGGDRVCITSLLICPRVLGQIKMTICHGLCFDSFLYRNGLLFLVFYGCNYINMKYWDWPTCLLTPMWYFDIVLASCVNGCGFDPQPSHTKDFKTGSHYFSARHVAYGRWSFYWSDWSQNNVSEWDDISTCRLLLLWLAQWKSGSARLTSTEQGLFYWSEVYEISVIGSSTTINQSIYVCCYYS